MRVISHPIPSHPTSQHLFLEPRSSAVLSNMIQVKLQIKNNGREGEKIHQWQQRSRGKIYFYYATGMGVRRLGHTYRETQMQEMMCSLYIR